MTENIFTPRTDAHPEPQGDPTLRRNLGLPKGVLQKNLKTFVYLGAALLVIVAALFSSSGKKTPVQQASAKGQPPQPMLQDNTDSNVQELKNQIQAERQKQRQATMPTRSPMIRRRIGRSCRSLPRRRPRAARTVPRFPLAASRCTTCPETAFAADGIGHRQKIAHGVPFPPWGDFRR